jgi:uncharacterized protein (TIGR02996 family)
MALQGYGESIQVDGKTIPVARRMTDEQAFLRAILDAPNDMAPRLVYADWLEEEHERRGPTPLGEICPKYQAVNIREQIAHGKAILDPLCNPHPDDFGMLRYHRNGFIELLYVSPADWAREADLITSFHPINQVVFSEPLGDLSIADITGPFVDVTIGDISFRSLKFSDDPLDYFCERWPQITFHTIKTGRSIEVNMRTGQTGGSRQVIELDPPDPRPIGDLLEIHAERHCRQPQTPQQIRDQMHANFDRMERELAAVFQGSEGNYPRRNTGVR